MTWLFIYIAALVLGVLLTGVAGLVREAPLRSANRRLVVPAADHRGGALGRAGARRCFGAGLLAAGIVGLLLSAWLGMGSTAAAAASLAAAVLVAACAALSLGHKRSPAPGGGRAVVVREMQPGGYGQIRIDAVGSSVVMAAHNVDTDPLPEGCEVEVLEGDRSVVAVRRVAPRP